MDTYDDDDDDDDQLGNSPFFDTEKFVHAKHLEPAEVIMRIEVLVMEFVKQSALPNGEIGFELVNSTNTNAHLVRDGIHLGKSNKKLLLFSNVTSQTFSRIWKVLAFVYGLLIDGKQATQREAYYCMVGDFPSQTELNNAILDVSSLLKCTRRSLGLMAGSKGEIFGHVQIQNKSNEPWFDCSRIPMQISGEMSPLIKVSSQARFILVIEKDGIFQRLCEDRIDMQIPCIMICGKGYPDLGTRAMVKHMVDKLSLPVLGIVDYNVHGLGILLSYKLGSVRMGLESFQYAVNIRWLALRGKSLMNLDLPAMSYQNLSVHDIKKIDSLLETPFIKKNPEYEDELKLMKINGKKAELQALFHLGRDGITKFICKMILSRQWI